MFSRAVSLELLAFSHLQLVEFYDHVFFISLSTECALELVRVASLTSLMSTESALQLVCVSSLASLLSNSVLCADEQCPYQI